MKTEASTSPARASERRITRLLDADKAGAGAAGRGTSTSGYDHVAPPRQYGCDPATPYGLGFRLPLIVISPYAKPGFIFHETSEQASIPRFIEKVFGATHTLSSLDPAAQDGQANDLMNAFDFTQAPLPPLVLPTRLCL